MVQNDYIGLLDSDTIVFKHPITKKDIKLYRVIAMKTFKLDRYDSQILSNLKELKEKHELSKTVLTDLNEEIENLSKVINDLTLQENFKRANELRNDLKTKEKLFENLSNDSDVLNLKIENCKNILDTRTIEIHTIGGYAESIDNFDPDTPVWIGNRARIFDTAKLLNGSLVTESALIFGNAKIDCSRIKNYARVHGNCQIEKSTLQDLCEVKGNSKLLNTQVKNSAMIFEDSIVSNTVLETGACIRGKCEVYNSILKDAAQVQGESIVDNCTLSGRYVITEGKHLNESYYEDYNLKTEFHSE
jgi:carbonic anhydrase/acetyltransferase-like protein (isoleucine patch superfamily)